jgi:hypothetical protein
VHLRAANLGSDGVLVQTVEEPHDDHVAFQIGQRGDHAGQRQQVFWFLPGPGRRDQVAETKVEVVTGWLSSDTSWRLVAAAIASRTASSLTSR